MIQVYADDARVYNASLDRPVFQNDVLIYDSRLEDYDLLGLKVTTGLNIGGTAEIQMAPGHPAYDVLYPYKTFIRIYRDGELRFRGRVLYDSDDILGRRTITCEGELCLLRDSIYRPYKKVGATPKSFFTTMINSHNSQMEVAKRFTIGSVTVSDTVIEQENETAEPVLDAVNKMVSAVGGYITFTQAEDGSRVINWLEDVGTHSGQVIEFGENLLNFSRTGANNDALATGLIPYGAKLEEKDDKGNVVKSTQRLTIEAANAQFPGKDYILAQDAVYQRGTIMMTKIWDDVTTANELYLKAEAYLNEEVKPWQFITSLELTAIDLSNLDKSIDTFTVGDMVLVRSAPHGVNTEFQLTKMTENLLNPAESSIVLGKDIPSLTGADVAGDKKGQASVSAVRHEMNGVDLTVYATKNDLGDYATKGELGGYATTEQLGGYATTGDLSGYATKGELQASEQALAQSINNEVTARKALVASTNGETYVKGDAVYIGEDTTEVVHIRSTDRVKVHGRLHMMDGMLDFSNNQGVRCYNTDGTVVYILRTDSNDNTIVGTAGNKLYLRGTTVYYGPNNAVVQSDRRVKHSIEELPDVYVEALDKMTPVRFKYSAGQSDRYHVGFIAQDVEAALTDAGLCGKDFGGFVDVNGDGSELGLAMDEFVGLLFQKIRKLEQRIKVLESDTQ